MAPHKSFAHPAGLTKKMLSGGLPLCLLLWLLWPAAAFATAYEADLAPQLFSAPDLCAYAPCQAVLPDAEIFSPRMGNPRYVEGYRNAGGRRERMGYVFLSTDVLDIPAYSGKPVITLIGMDTHGIITGVKVLKHSEPILLVGIPEVKLDAFVKQYVGKFAGARIEVGAARDGEDVLSVDAISGATVTVLAENQVIAGSAYQIARQVGIIRSTPKPQARFTKTSVPLDWNALLREDSIRRLTIQPWEVGVADEGQPYLDLYFGYLNAPNIGRNVLGETGYQRLLRDLKPGEHALFIIGNGTASFKGSGFVRGGIYDRIRVIQGMDTFTFRDTDYQNLYGIDAPDAPDYRESGIFILRGPEFSAAYPWKLVFLANKLDPQSGTKSFTNFDQEYWLPAPYLEGGRPRVENPAPTWLRTWQSRKIEIGAFFLVLLSAAATFTLRDRLVRRANHKDKRWTHVPRYLIWTTSVGFLGFYLMAQPSITQVLTWFHALVHEWRWELFLSDPFIFLFWWFIIATVFLWGRGLFCGWLCPYGALSELAFRIASTLGLRRFQFQLPKPLHDRLKWLKYGIFLGLLGVSFHSMTLAERLAEVEPFKTTFLLGVWERSWPFVAYWTALFGLSLFMERPFCKYLCPLGAGLAIPSRLRLFKLRRKTECQTCKACAAGCGSQSIDTNGRIDPKECMLCLDCMVMYYDAHACPPLAKARKTRERAGLPLTRIGKDGYFLPLQPAGGACPPKHARSP